MTSLAESGEETKPSRVVWITPNLSASSGGPTTTTVNGIIAERQAGLPTEIVTTVGLDGHGDSMPALERLTAAGATIRCFPRVGRSRSAETWGLSPTMVFWMIRNLGTFDVVHLQYVWCMTSVVGCLLAKLRGIPVVVTPHESLTDHDIEIASRNALMKTFKKALRHFYMRTVDCLIFMSKLEERDTQFGNRRSVRIFHAVAERTSLPENAVLSQPQQPLHIGFLGRNAGKKGIDRLIETLSGPDPQSAWQLTLATSALTSKQIEIIGSLRARDRVHWQGFVKEASGLFAVCDVLVMPSTYEGFGMVAAEAMAHGVPVVVPESSGVAEIVSAYEAGIVVREASVDELVTALLRFDRDRGKWAEYRVNGLRAVDEKLTYRNYSTATTALYESLT